MPPAPAAVTSASMIRTFRPSRHDRYEPSGRQAATCGLREDRARATSTAPVRSILAKNQLASKARSPGPACRAAAGEAAGRRGQSHPGQARSRAWRRAGRGCRSQPKSSAAGPGSQPGPSGNGSCRSTTGCGQYRGSSPSCSHRRRRYAARRSERPACVAEPAAQPRSRTVPSAGRGPDGGADPAGPFRGTGERQAGQARGQLAPHPHITQAREHPQGKHEADTHPRRQDPQPPPHRPGLLQDIIDQPGPSGTLDRDLPRFTLAPVKRMAKTGLNQYARLHPWDTGCGLTTTDLRCWLGKNWPDANAPCAHPQECVRRWDRGADPIR